MEVELTSNITRALALSNNLINGIESLIEDCLCSNAYIGNDFSSVEDLLDGEIEVMLSECNYEPDNLFELNELLRFNLVRGVHVSIGNSGTDFRKLYGLAAKLCSEKVIPYMRCVSMKTAATRIEYMYIILKNGRAELLEGDVDMVTIPHVDASLMLHTHGYGCIPSLSDLKTASHVFLDGGLGVGVVSPTCYFLIFRFGPFTEEDYIALKNIHKLNYNPILPGETYISTNLAILTG